MSPSDLLRDVIEGAVVWRAVWMALVATFIAGVWFAGLLYARDLVD